MKGQQKSGPRGARTIIGKLSGKEITIPDVSVPPMPALAPPGVIHNGRKAENFGEIDSSRGYPAVRSSHPPYDKVDDASDDSFPASDAPAWTGMSVG